MSEDTDSAKDRAAFAGAALVQDGMTVGLGSGSTAALMVRHLADRLEREGLRIVGVPTSDATAELARRLNVPLRALDEVSALDLNLDGADEIDPAFHMVKGRGGALLREKIVACSAARRATMITAEKRVARLGLTAPIPVEVSTFGLAHTERRLQRFGASTVVRRQSGGLIVLTDGGNAIIDCRFTSLDDPAALDARLQRVAGVLDTGLFIGLCDVLIVGSEQGAEVIERPATTPRAQD